MIYSVISFSRSVEAFNSLINADPIMAPFAYLEAKVNVSLSLILNPIKVGFFNLEFLMRSKYSILESINQSDLLN